MKMSRIALLLAFGLGLAVVAPRSAQAADTVDVKIEVIQASRTAKGFKGPTERYKKNLAGLGYVGARLVDTVTALKRAKGSRVELRFKDPERKEQAVQVQVLEVKPEPKLKISIPAYRVSSQTTHRGGGAYLVVAPGKNIILAVVPKR